MGKTQLINWFVNDQYEEGLEPTDGEVISDVTFDNDGDWVKVRLVDTWGVEESVGLTSTYFRGADGILAVCANDDDTVTEITTIYEDEVEKVKGGKCPTIFVLNKCDEEPEGEGEGEADEQVNDNLQILKNLAETYETDAFEVSAKTGWGVEDAFNALFKKALSSE